MIQHELWWLFIDDHGQEVLRFLFGIVMRTVMTTLACRNRGQLAARHFGSGCSPSPRMVVAVL